MRGFPCGFNYGFLGDIATTNGGAVAAEAAQFVMSNIGFNIVRMDMPSYFYEVMANVLAAGTVYKLYYPNYQIFTCQTTFGHLISFQATGENDLYSISGLDSSQQPLSLA